MLAAPAFRRFVRDLLFGLGLLCASYLLLYFICRYRASLPLPSGVDPLAALLPSSDWTPLLSYGFIAFQTAFYLYWIANAPRRLPYLLASTGLLMLVRDFFVLLTPVSVLPGFIPLYSQRSLSALRGTLFFDNELFFSGHAGVPFLYALICRGERALSTVCLAVSAAMALGVLLTRNHYSIDVLGAYFIVPTVHALGRRLLSGLEGAP